MNSSIHPKSIHNSCLRSSSQLNGLWTLILQLFYYDGECLINNRSKNVLLLFVLLMYDVWSLFWVYPNIRESTFLLLFIFQKLFRTLRFCLNSWSKMTKYYQKQSLSLSLSLSIVLQAIIWAWSLSKTSMQLWDPPNQINSPWCVWWSQPWRSFRPTHWTSCTLQALSGTSCHGSLGAHRRASCHWSRCRRRCRLCGSGLWHWDSRPPGPSSDLRTQSAHTGARWTTQAPGFKQEGNHSVKHSEKHPAMVICFVPYAIYSVAVMYGNLVQTFMVPGGRIQIT